MQDPQSPSDFDRQMMQRAIELAKAAAAEGEVPVGAVLTLDGKIIGEGQNRNITSLDPSAHAEMLAIRQAAKAIGNYRLIGATMYVTLEPCSMCAGLMVHSRIERLVFGAPDYKTGACGSISNIVNDERLNHQVQVRAPLMQEECSSLLSEFFKRRREEKKRLKRQGS